MSFLWSSSRVGYFLLRDRNAGREGDLFSNGFSIRRVIFQTDDPRQGRNSVYNSFDDSIHSASICVVPTVAESDLSNSAFLVTLNRQWCILIPERSFVCPILEDPLFPPSANC